MWGATIGDIVGSGFEGTGIKTKEFDLLTHDCRYTDDSVCTAAVAASLLDGLPAGLTLRVWCHRYVCVRTIARSSVCSAPPHGRSRTARPAR